MRKKAQVIVRLGAIFVLMISQVQCDGLFGLFGEEEKEKCVVGATLPCECALSGAVFTSSQVCGADGTFGECECGFVTGSEFYDELQASPGGALFDTPVNDDQSQTENGENSSSPGSSGTFTGTFQLP